MKSKSTGHSAHLHSWINENFDLFKMRIKGLKKKKHEIERVFDEIDELVKGYELYSGQQYSSAKLLEIGYGARPIKMFALYSSGFDVVGIDIDRPSLSFSMGEAFRIFRLNGVNRMFKTAMRSLMFDRHERTVLNERLMARGHSLKINPQIFMVGDALTLNQDQIYDIIYSDNVFEHIPSSDLRALCSKMKSMLSKDGVAVITPDVFTGLSGGHLTEWYPDFIYSTGSRRHTEPWEHLRKRRRVADCYLNKLRLQDYVDLFSEYFKINLIQNLDPNRGRAFLTPDIANELSEYSIEELLSGPVRFWLTHKGLSSK